MTDYRVMRFYLDTNTPTDHWRIERSIDGSPWLCEPTAPSGFTHYGAACAYVAWLRATANQPQPTSRWARLVRRFSAGKTGNTSSNPRGIGGPLRMEWQPIETAPKETDIWIGRYVNESWAMCQSSFCYDAGSAFLGEPPCWFWASDYDSQSVTDDEGPSHWMPLPEPPQ